MARRNSVLREDGVTSGIEPKRIVAVAALGFFGFACTGTLAQESEPTVRELQERLEQQDQRIRELEEIVRRLEGAAMESERAAMGEAPPAAPEQDMTSAGPASRITAAIESGSPAGVDAPEDDDDIPGELRETHQLLTRDELVSDEFPGSWPMFGNDTRLKIGGYIKTDFVADFDGTLDSTQFLMRTIPVEGTPEFGGDSYVDFFAKETRFNLDIRRSAPGKLPLRGFIEGDFFSADNEFRLRHAYITGGNFIIGQTWTTLSFLESLPYMIDFGAGDALFGGRAAQIRYQYPVNDRWKLSVALEDLQFVGIQNANDLPGRATSQLPLLALRADYRHDTGVLLFGAGIGQLHWDGGADGPSDSATQLSLIVAGRQNLGSRAYASWNVSYGNGSGENILAFAGTDANAVLDASGVLDPFPALSALIGFGYDWTSTLTSNLGWAYGWLDTPDTRADLALERGGTGHLNLIWKPDDDFSTGVEFMWGKTRAQNGAEGDATRLQLMAKYEF
jgi:hypothetical protein